MTMTVAELLRQAEANLSPELLALANEVAEASAEIERRKRDLLARVPHEQRLFVRRYLETNPQGCGMPDKVTVSV